MSYGVEQVDGKMRRFGFFSVKDWLESVVLSFPAPWALRPRKGKYYGTAIQDARGRRVLRVWMMAGGPSEREKARFSPWTQAIWDDYCCDSHWESAAGLAIAELMVHLRNEIAVSDWHEEHCARLVTLIVEYGNWDEECWEEISAGGPEKRALYAVSDHLEPPL